MCSCAAPHINANVVPSPRPGLARGDDHDGVGNDDDDDDDDRDGGRSFAGWIGNGNDERKERARSVHAFPLLPTLRIPRFPASSSSAHARTHNVTRSTTTTIYDVRAAADQSREKAKIRREIYLLSLHPYFLSLSLDRCYTATYFPSLACAVCISSPSKSILSVRPFPLPPSDGFCSPSSRSSTCTIPPFPLPD